MARKMKKDGLVLNVVEHIILKNFWEYYIIEDKPGEGSGDPDIVFALVMGHETELGNVSLAELKPYIISRTADLNIYPAEGYEWVDEEAV